MSFILRALHKYINLKSERSKECIGLTMIIVKKKKKNR